MNDLEEGRSYRKRLRAVWYKFVNGEISIRTYIKFKCKLDKEKRERHGKGDINTSTNSK